MSCCVGLPKMDGSWWRGLTKHGPLETGMATTSAFLLENPMNTMKRQKDMTLKDESPRALGVQYAIGEKQRKSSRRNEESEPKQK